jgi:RNA polymerase sigma-70 factor (ECF subfamily)
VAIDDPAVSDDALVARLLNRDEDALAILYDRHGRAAFTLARHILRASEPAEEVVQEAFLTLWRRAETYRPERGAVRNWLLRVVRNRAIDVLRARSQEGPIAPSVEDLPLVAVDDPEGETIRAVEGRVVREALAELPPEQREVVELAYFGGLAYPEVATRMAIPLGTVKSRMRLAIERLRALLRARELGA